MTSSRRQLLIVGVLVAVVMWVGPVSWARGQAESVQADAKRASSATKALGKKVNEALAVKKKESSIRDEIEAAKVKYPADTEQAALLREVQDAASASSVQVKTSSFSDPEQTKGSAPKKDDKAVPGKVIAGNLSVAAADEGKLAAFLAALRNAPRVIAVDAVSVARQGQAGTTAALTVRAFTWSGGAAK